MPLRTLLRLIAACVLMLAVMLLAVSALSEEPSYLTGFRRAMRDMAEKPIHRVTHIEGDLPSLLERVNRTVNNVPYIELDGIWSTPKEFYAHGGQCRDYAVAKYYRLYDAGIADTDMELAIFQVGSGNWHAVLLVHSDGWLYVLDNRTPVIMRVQRFEGIKINRITIKP